MSALILSIDCARAAILDRRRDMIEIPAANRDRQRAKQPHWLRLAVSRRNRHTE